MRIQAMIVLAQSEVTTRELTLSRAIPVIIQDLRALKKQEISVFDFNPNFRDNGLGYFRIETGVGTVQLTHDYGCIRSRDTGELTHLYDRRNPTEIIDIVTCVVSGVIQKATEKQQIKPMRPDDLLRSLEKLLAAQS